MTLTLNSRPYFIWLPGATPLYLPLIVALEANLAFFKRWVRLSIHPLHQHDWDYYCGYLTPKNKPVVVDNIIVHPRVLGAVCDPMRLNDFNNALIVASMAEKLPFWLYPARGQLALDAGSKKLQERLFGWGVITHDVGMTSHFVARQIQTNLLADSPSHILHGATVGQEFCFAHRYFFPFFNSAVIISTDPPFNGENENAIDTLIPSLSKPHMASAFLVDKSRHSQLSPLVSDICSAIIDSIMLLKHNADWCAELLYRSHWRAADLFSAPRLSLNAQMLSRVVGKYKHVWPDQPTERKLTHLENMKVLHGSNIDIIPLLDPVNSVARINYVQSTIISSDVEPSYPVRRSATDWFLIVGALLLSVVGLRLLSGYSFDPQKMPLANHYVDYKHGLLSAVALALLISCFVRILNRRRRMLVCVSESVASIKAIIASKAAVKFHLFYGLCCALFLVAALVYLVAALNAFASNSDTTMHNLLRSAGAVMLLILALFCAVRLGDLVERHDEIIRSRSLCIIGAFIVYLVFAIFLGVGGKDWHSAFVFKYWDAYVTTVQIVVGSILGAGAFLALFV